MKQVIITNNIQQRAEADIDPDAVSMLNHRLRRWFNIEPSLVIISCWLGYVFLKHQGFTQSEPKLDSWPLVTCSSVHAWPTSRTLTQHSVDVGPLFLFSIQANMPYSYRMHSMVLYIEPLKSFNESRANNPIYFDGLHHSIALLPECTESLLYMYSHASVYTMQPI